MCCHESSVPQRLLADLADAEDRRDLARPEVQHPVFDRTHQRGAHPLIPPCGCDRKSSDPSDIATHRRDNHPDDVIADGCNHRRPARAKVNEGFHKIDGTSVHLPLGQLDETQDAIEITRMRIANGP